MKKDTVLVAICNQKGGVGKSTMTIMLAGYYHYLKGLNVAVIDCDYPQYSLVRMKERDMRTVEQSEYFKQLLKRELRLDYRGSARNGELIRRNQHHREYGLRDYTDCSRPYCNAKQSLVLYQRLGLRQGKQGSPFTGIPLFLEPKRCPCFYGSL